MQTIKVSDFVSKRLSLLIEQRAHPSEQIMYDVGIMVGQDEDGPTATVGIFLGVACPEIGDDVYSTCHASFSLNRAVMSAPSIDDALGRLWDHVETNRLSMTLSATDHPDDNVGRLYSD